MRKRSLHHIRSQLEGGHLQTKKRALTRNRVSWHLHLGLLKLQSYEKQVSFVYTIQSMVFCKTAQTKQKHSVNPLLVNFYHHLINQ